VLAEDQQVVTDQPKIRPSPPAAVATQRIQRPCIKINHALPGARRRPHDQTLALALGLDDPG
jgi:hypothetical protein